MDKPSKKPLPHMLTAWVDRSDFEYLKSRGFNVSELVRQSLKSTVRALKSGDVSKIEIKTEAEGEE